MLTIKGTMVSMGIQKHKRIRKEAYRTLRIHWNVLIVNQSFDVLIEF